MFCENCRKEIAEDMNFCAKCGNRKVEKGNVNSAIAEVKENELDSTVDALNSLEVQEVKEYKFDKEGFVFLWVMPKRERTCITIKGNDLSSRQHNEVMFIKYSKKNLDLSVDDITGVSVEKVFSWKWVMLGAIGLLATVAGGNLVAAILAIMALLFIKQKKVVIFSKVGQIAFSCSATVMDEVKELTKHLKRINSNIDIKID
ncbi:zinc ribbon domain-containing protein [Anaerosinus sp.]|uniref:zinc ribbon domain-containing protein n=1 Tax=Selenobaculum sp. TaxID=3074374 RepID=UPI003AB8BB0C